LRRLKDERCGHTQRQHCKDRRETRALPMLLFLAAENQGHALRPDSVLTTTVTH
jgi:hypothetical protein